MPDAWLPRVALTSPLTSGADLLNCYTHRMSRKFTRTIEDFVCERCGAFVRGQGYTNHCPVCLYSKHVDVNPGDRAAECGGLMEPIGVRLKHGDHVLIHRCVKCGALKRNRTAPEDSRSEIFEVMRGRSSYT